jgi:uncharacterized membrane protein
LENALHIFFIWLHILGIALWAGGQFFLAFAWVPASREISHLPTRVKAMRVLTDRFLYLGGGGLLVIIVAGLYLISDFPRYHGQSFSDFYAIRYGTLFTIKMVLLAVMLVVVGIHTFVVGPRLVEALDAQARGEPVTDAEVRQRRMRSMWYSITGLVLTLIIMVLGATLNAVRFSLAEI